MRNEKTGRQAPALQLETPKKEIIVGKRSQFSGEDSRFLVKVGPRNIAVIYFQGKFYALDNACYHHGGSLLMGDIEDLGGHRCLICPWHRYPIALETGEGLYKGIEMDPNTRLPAPGEFTVKSKGCKQRVHEVKVVGEDVVLVVNQEPHSLESDAYATMELANREEMMMEPVERTAAHSHKSSGTVLHSCR